MSERLERLVALDVPHARCDESFPPGTIGIISADLARYPSFEMSVCGVKYPFGSTIDRRIGCDLVESCNKLVRYLQGDWLWLLGDDHVFDTNLLLHLLSRMYDDGCDLVAPLVMARQAPFPTVVGQLDPTDRRIDGIPVGECQGLQLRDVVGSAGLLVRRRVFEKMGSPWFQAGSIRRTSLGEDWDFCIRAKRLGFQLFVDSDLLMGHTTSLCVWPYKPGTPEAGVLLDLGSGQHVVVRHEVKS